MSATNTVAPTAADSAIFPSVSRNEPAYEGLERGASSHSRSRLTHGRGMISGWAEESENYIDRVRTSMSGYSLGGRSDGGMSVVEVMQEGYKAHRQRKPMSTRATLEQANTAPTFKESAQVAGKATGTKISAGSRRPATSMDERKATFSPLKQPQYKLDCDVEALLSYPPSSRVSTQESGHKRPTSRDTGHVIQSGRSFALAQQHRWGNKTSPNTSPMATPLAAVSVAGSKYSCFEELPHQPQHHSHDTSRSDTAYTFRRGWRNSTGVQEKMARERSVRVLIGRKKGRGTFGTTSVGHSVQDLLAEIVVDDGVMNALSRNLPKTRMVPVDLKEGDAKLIQRSGKSTAGEGFFDKETVLKSPTFLRIQESRRLAQNARRVAQYAADYQSKLLDLENFDRFGPIDPHPQDSNQQIQTHNATEVPAKDEFDVRSLPRPKTSFEMLKDGGVFAAAASRPVNSNSWRIQDIPMPKPFARSATTQEVTAPTLQVADDAKRPQTTPIASCTRDVVLQTLNSRKSSEIAQGTNEQLQQRRQYSNGPVDKFFIYCGKDSANQSMSFDKVRATSSPGFQRGSPALAPQSSLIFPQATVARASSIGFSPWTLMSPSPNASFSLRTIVDDEDRAH